MRPSARARQQSQQGDVMYLEKFKVTQRVALVTGGGRGIGLGCVEALAEAGGRVVIADFDAQVAESGRDAMKTKGYDVDLALMDVTKPDDVTSVADALVRKHGRIDILVNNA